MTCLHSPRLPRGSSIDTLDIVRTYIDPNPKKSGSENVFVRCPHPDHEDHSRENCSVSLTKSLFNCFACGAKGHLVQALRWVNAPDFIVSAVSSADSRPLIGGGYTPVERYLDDDILFAYDHAPTAWINEGFSPDLLAEHGIGYDHYLDRVTVPIRDLHNNLIAISGRNLSDTHAGKYKVYRSELGEFQPHNYSPRVHDHLWRANLLESPDAPLVIVEGYKAALWLVQCGLTSTVAIMGSQISDAQADIVSRLCDESWLMLDMDEAGRRGQQLSAIKLYRRGINVKCVHYARDVRQPDDMSLAEVHESFLNLQHWRS